VTILPPRSSSPSLVVVARRIASLRDELASKWASWLTDRQAGSPTLDPNTTGRMLLLITDLLVVMAGPMRREGETTWSAATQLYGRLAALRGLAAGEVVEELQHLRELLIREMADFFVALPARQALPTVLRINRVLDAAVANAVVGYTDTLVFKMFAAEGVLVPIAESVQAAITQLDAIEADFRLLAERLPS
jgi:hypothetical protein